MASASCPTVKKSMPKKSSAYMLAPHRSGKRPVATVVGYAPVTVPACTSKGFTVVRQSRWEAREGTCVCTVKEYYLDAVWQRLRAFDSQCVFDSNCFQFFFLLVRMLGLGERPCTSVSIIRTHRVCLPPTLTSKYRTKTPLVNP